MVLTDEPANRVPVSIPAGYDPAAYEFLFRSIEVGQKSGFLKLSMVPNRKTDSNNTGGISCDWIGGNYGKDWNWARSSTHIAFGSIRMEPGFMILGQGAATAACMAIDADTSVQAVPYKGLRAWLVIDDQRLE